MKFYYVYILLCADGLTYTGFTNNISRRFEEHQNGRNKTCFTYNRRPLQLFFIRSLTMYIKLFILRRKSKGGAVKRK